MVIPFALAFVPLNQSHSFYDFCFPALPLPSAARSPSTLYRETKTAQAQGNFNQLKSECKASHDFQQLKQISRD
jgi:hypothetical protein